MAKFVLQYLLEAFVLIMLIANVVIPIFTKKYKFFWWFKSKKKKNSDNKKPSEEEDIV